MKIYALKYRSVFAACVLSAATAKAAIGVDIVGNGSFEVHPSVPPPPWTGSFGLFIGVPGAANGTNFAILDTGYFASQTLTTTPGSIYHLSFAVSGNSSFPGTSVAKFNWDDGPTGTTTWLSPNTSGDGTHYNWVYGNFDLTATSGLTTLRFERDGSSTSAGTFLDDVRVTEVSEPSSLALMSAGLWFGCRLHRRIRRVSNMHS
jgi:hypothetical protein